VRRLFIDENLPRTLGDKLASEFLHSTDLGERLSDEEIWRRGRVGDWIVLTQDTDFFDRLVLEGPPPRVVWVRTGNLRRRAMEELLVRVWPEVERLLEKAALVEIHADVVEGISFDPEPR
jgi:predicted nuclease of predicted toxin-antitoxin system